MEDELWALEKNEKSNFGRNMFPEKGEMIVF